MIAGRCVLDQMMTSMCYLKLRVLLLLQLTNNMCSGRHNSGTRIHISN